MKVLLLEDIKNILEELVDDSKAKFTEGHGTSYINGMLDLYTMIEWKLCKDDIGYLMGEPEDDFDDDDLDY